MSFIKQQRFGFHLRGGTGGSSLDFVCGCEMMGKYEEKDSLWGVLVWCECFHMYLTVMWQCGCDGTNEIYTVCLTQRDRFRKPICDHRMMENFNFKFTKSFFSSDLASCTAVLAFQPSKFDFQTMIWLIKGCVAFEEPGAQKFPGNHLQACTASFRKNWTR